MENSVQTNVSWRLVVAVCFLSCLWAITPASQGADAKQPTDPRNVSIHIEHGIELPPGRPGFRIDIRGWLPHGALSIHAISPSGEKIELVPLNNPLHADEGGDMTVDVDYGRKGLSQGHWMLLIAGKPGVHVVQTDLPLVEAPTASRPKWKLTFGTPSQRKEK